MHPEPAERTGPYISRRRLKKYLRRKRSARTARQFDIWAMRYHAYRNRHYGQPDPFGIRPSLAQINAKPPKRKK